MTTPTETSGAARADGRQVALPERLGECRLKVGAPFDLGLLLTRGDRVRTHAGTRVHELSGAPFIHQPRNDMVMAAEMRNVSTGKQLPTPLRIDTGRVDLVSVHVTRRDRTAIAGGTSALWGYSCTENGALIPHRAVRTAERDVRRPGVPLSVSAPAGQAPQLIFRPAAAMPASLAVQIAGPDTEGGTARWSTFPVLFPGEAVVAAPSLEALRVLRDLMVTPAPAMDHLLDLLTVGRPAREIATAVTARYAGVDESRIDWSVLAPLAQQVSDAPFIDLVRAAGAATA